MHLQSPTTRAVSTSSSSSSASIAEPTPDTQNSSTHAVRWRRIHNALGFSKGYNFPLYIIFAGALFAFSLARLSYLNISGSASSSYANGASPGEWYWFQHPTSIYRIGITLHLVTIVPAGLLFVWQFLPIIRHKAMIFHRINGYVILLLVFAANIGALMVVRHAFGGGLETQAVVGVLAIITTISMALAYYNIKRLQVDQHRAWMLRAVFYFGIIVTERLIMIIAALVISKIGSYGTAMTCGEVLSVYDGSEEEAVVGLYPTCANLSAAAARHTMVFVSARFADQPEQIGASLRMSFGMALWMALFLHATGVEIYLGLTPRESESLRMVSYERQMERGLEPAGSAGMTSDRWGDAKPWTPAATKLVDVSQSERKASM